MESRAPEGKEVIIVLHEIYGVNQHIESVCERFRKAGYDVICPNLIGRASAFDYDLAEQAYRHFMETVGFAAAVALVKASAKRAKQRYARVYLLGYSVGATIAWLCSAEAGVCDGMIGYYGSRIRDAKEIIPQCPQRLLFASEEAFNVKRLVRFWERRKVNARVIDGKHGFADPFSRNYCAKAANEAENIVNDFLNELKK